MADRIRNLNTDIAAMEALEAPDWLGRDALAQARSALQGPLARETWKYSSLPRMLRSLLAGRIEQRTPAAPDKTCAWRAISPSARPPTIDLNRYPLAAVTAALSGAGWRLRIRQSLPEPLQLDTIAGCLTAPIWLQVDAGCRVSVENRWAAATPGDDESAGGHLLLISLAEGAELELTQTSLAPAGRNWMLLQADLAADARFSLHQHRLGAGDERLDGMVRLNGAGARFSNSGSALIDNGARLDMHLVIEHLGKNTQSRVRQHAVGTGRSTTAFNGRIHIHPGGAGADAQLNSRNLTLGANAVINSKPELEIYNDDVRCAHGATVGQIDEGALLYLRSRGLPLAEARRLLCLGFLRAGLEGPEQQASAEAFEQLLGRLAA